MWRLALLVVLALSVRAQNDDSDRLLTSVRQPVIVEANVPNITVGFKTGPNIPGTQFTIKCVLEGEACDAPPQGQPVSGSLPVKPAAVEGTVQDLEVDQTYSCFVKTTLSENGKVSFCQEATPTPGIVRFELKFPGYRDAAAFGQQDREQVCANVLSLQPGGICTVLRVVNGSAIVFIQVEDGDYRNIWSLTETLAQNETEVTAALTSGLEGSVEIADIQTEPPLPSPLPPTDVTANPSSDCMPSVTVTWTAPQRSSTITGYFVSCKSMTAPTANSTVAATQRNVSLPIQAGEEYMCSVVSQGPSGTSVPADASSLVMYRYPESCKPGTVTNVQTSFVSYANRFQRTVEWSAPSQLPELEITSYNVNCSSDVDFRVLQVENTRATLGDGVSENAPFNLDTSYTCTVTATNTAGAGAPSDPSDPFVGGRLPQTGDFIVPQSSFIEDYLPGQWFYSTLASGGSQIITNPVPGEGSPGDDVVELTTTCSNDDLAGVKLSYFPGSIFNGMLFSEFLANFSRMSYKYYKVGDDPQGCTSSVTSPTFKFEVFSQKADDNDEPSYTTFVWEPYSAPPLNGSPAPSGSWQSVQVSKSDGTATFDGNGGWRSTRDLGQGNSFQNQASLATWESFLSGNEIDGKTTSSPQFIMDGVIWSISVEIGRFNPGLVTYTNDIQVSSGDYDWSFTFTTE